MTGVARHAGTAARTLLPIALTLLLGGCVLLLLGQDPLLYYGTVLQRGLLTSTGLQQAVIRTAPLLLVTAGLIVAFRTGIWNLGGDGQFLLASVTAAALAPGLARFLPLPLAWLLCAAAAMLVAAAWSLAPALLKARYGINEIITSLMTSFLGVSLANLLIKLALRDPATTVPQTLTLPEAARLPRLFGSTVDAGVVIAVAVALLVHLLLTRTAFGLRLTVLGASPRAAAHLGLDVKRLTVGAFALSAALCGLAGAVEILGVWGNVRADWNPAYGLPSVALAFLARRNAAAAIAVAFGFAALLVGAESASRRLGVPQYLVLVLVAVLLVVLALADRFAPQGGAA